jgi:hypothetical protein
VFTDLGKDRLDAQPADRLNQISEKYRAKTTQDADDTGQNNRQRTRRKGAVSKTCQDFILQV